MNTQERERTSRLKVSAEMKRTSVVSQIKAIHAAALRTATDDTSIPAFLLSVHDLDSLWCQFKLEDATVLDYLVHLDQPTDYSPDLPGEVRAVIHEIRAIADKLTPKGADAIDFSYIHQQTRSKGQHNIESSPTCDAARATSRLPEIPLPQYDGDFRYWPTFHDRFSALVDTRPHLSNVDKLYYLLGCLKGPAANAVRGIPVSADNYALVWTTLSNRFNRPRLVATSLIDKLLHASSFSQESIHDLNSFVYSFSEDMSLLKALKIPDAESFILFSIAFRCLPLSTRKLFESHTTSDYPSIDELIEFVHQRVAILELVGDPRKTTSTSSGKTGHPPPTTQARRGGERTWKPDTPRHTSLVASKPGGSTTRPCPCCTGSHGLAACTRFKGWAVDERSRWARDQRLCFMCFSADHWAPKCPSKSRCQNCAGKHHLLLHPPSSINRVDNTASRQPDTSLCASTSAQLDCTSTSVILGTALVHMRDRHGSWQTMRALVDCASQISAVTVSCADRLGLKRSKWTAPVSGLAGVPVSNVKGRVECHVQPRYANDPVLTVHAWVLPHITGVLPQKLLPPTVKDSFSNMALADPNFYVPAPVDVLLGGDLYPTIMTGRQITVDESLPTAFNSIFGWILIGPISDIDAKSYRSLPVSLTVSIESMIQQFWQVEEPDAAPATFTEEGRCEQIFLDQCTRLPSGRFAVPLPFRNSIPDDTFSGSREIAIRRFESLERKLSANPKLKLLYNDFMNEYIALGHMSIARTPGCYFIPHHAVYRPDVDDTKLRVVFDASARSYSSPSLNSCLLAGPKLQQDIVDILMRFRTYPHVFTADICKMYRQILVLQPYRKYQHVFWRSSSHDQLTEYELNTVTYGMNCAPYLALRVLQSIATDDCSNFEPVRDALKYQTYVDDVCVGADTETGVLSLQSDLISILGKAGLELKKWSSNASAVLDAVPPEHRLNCPLPFDTKDDSGVKVLGLQWHTNGDFFGCALRLDGPVVYTKRGLLSLIARIFDPLGLFAPTIFYAKCIMQRTWLTKLGWDDPLPMDIHHDWSSFVDELPSLCELKVPRHFSSYRRSACRLLGFCDASQQGYAAVIYIRLLTDTGKPSISLVGTKTKLAPVQQLTIPRLELNAALLLARWMSRVHRLLDPELVIVQSYAWTDSAIVLSWLTNIHESFKIYVSNRVHQIVSLLPDCQWRHVKSAENPADCASRGVTPSALANSFLYWNGPTFIRDDPATWSATIPSIPFSELPETRPVSLITNAETISEWFIGFSSYDRLVRVTARMYRFIRRCRKEHLDQFSLHLTRVELDIAIRSLVAHSQLCHLRDLSRELSSGQRVSSRPLAKLRPFFDPVGTIRVGGRLSNSTLRYECKHPILLTKDAHLSFLICRQWHHLSCHAGPRLVTALVSRQFWVISIRSVVHKVARACSVCVRFDARPPQPLMADLPSARVHRSRPFSRVGIDYAGPLQMRELRLRKSRTYKVYIAIFVCFAVKAVHLELVTELSRDAFLAAFDRFVARRGVPSEIYSDCGTNFVGADRQLQQLVNSPDNRIDIAESRALCQWHFNPPGSPHFGGLWEAAVRSTKRLLFRTMGTHIFTYEELSTLITRIEAVLNSRPLTPLTADPSDLDYLSPGHFLIGQPLLAVPPRVSWDAKVAITHRWKLLDQCHQMFWKKWSAEYLTTLQTRSKWTSEVPNIKTDDMVIVIDNQAPPLRWKLGRVVEVLPGPDGIVRVAQILTRTGTVTRAAHKLVLLPTQ